MIEYVPARHMLHEPDLPAAPSAFNKRISPGLQTCDPEKNATGEMPDSMLNPPIASAPWKYSKGCLKRVVVPSDREWLEKLGVTAKLKMHLPSFISAKTCPNRLIDWSLLRAPLREVKAVRPDAESLSMVWL